MMVNGKEARKEDFLAVNSEIYDKGITVSVKCKKYRIEYPEDIWKAYSPTNKEVLLDNLAYMQTCHLAASHKKKGAVYNTAMPCFEAQAFKGTMFDIPSTAVIDYEKTTDYMRRFFNARFMFSSYDISMPEKVKRKWYAGKTPTTAIILFTGGKESLLNLALCLEMGIRPIPVYMDEEPDEAESQHKQKIISAIEEGYGIKVYRLLNEPGKLRYCDLGEEENNWGAGTQFLTYTLLVQPFVQHFDADYILFGNEYSCDDYTYCKEKFKSNFCFDQCSEWTKQLNFVAKAMMGNSVEVGSLVSPLYEIALVKILHARYPHIGQLQMSCFSDNEEGKTRVWCGNCSKCARMFVFFKALGIDVSTVGFENNMFNKPSMNNYSMFGTKGLYSYDVSGLGSEEQRLAFYMAAERGEKGYLVDKFRRMKAYREMKENFGAMSKKYFSQYDSFAIPLELKENVMDIFDETLRGEFTAKDFRLKQAVQAQESASSTVLGQQ